jgi:hypothetical protein
MRVSRDWTLHLAAEAAACTACAKALIACAISLIYSLCISQLLAQYSVGLGLDLTKNLLYAYARSANSKNHRFDNAGVLHASGLGNFTIGNGVVPCNLSGDFCSVHMQSQLACGFRGFGHYTRGARK